MKTDRRPKLELNPALDAPLLTVMNFLNDVSVRFPQAVSFAPGRPVESLCEVDQVALQLERYIAYRAREPGGDAEKVRAGLGQYGKTNGIINDLLVRHLALDEQIHVEPSALMVTAGAQEAMVILLRGLFRPDGDVLLVTDPNYVGLLGAAQMMGVPMVPVATGEDGIDLGSLRRVIAEQRAAGRHPKALYDVPDFHNPLGTRLPLEKREELLRIAGQENLLIIEDNPYGMFDFDGERVPTLKSLDRDARVIYLNSFSKVLFPGLRVGFLVADQRVGGQSLAEALSKVKSLTTINTSNIIQAVVGGFLIESDCRLWPRVQGKVGYYRKNRDQMMGALERHFGVGSELEGQLRWNRPQGGFFLTLDSPFEWSHDDVVHCAEHYGVLVCPMSFFTVEDVPTRRLRLAFSYVTPEQIDQGIERLARFVSERSKLAARGGRREAV